MAFALYSMAIKMFPHSRAKIRDIKAAVARGIKAAQTGDVMGRVGVGIEISVRLKELAALYPPEK